ncbi:MAG: ATP-dependent sacrificial sulfur transferase LarE [Acidobacteria bacterium]|nr:MAG: ATP-dependent sacrificial sulfur transferase LarE [Acidobacteriota bacterium]REK01206.1 MAG: ATP-dependent sacrificial sulfur transferase LarE [Acidobacteriota bacterium]REK14162.1 MAG: ATP-dependent sacrificial sulfur transferase LarE [Acidobacteriota bacterium]REK44877.1 MAG: ATP-dependent sacrificial sulfur transferase LarE [Acidobacteriota bacterium]
MKTACTTATDPDVKEEELVKTLNRYSSVIVAFSGGVDSTYLAFVANRELGSDALAVTGVSPSVAAEHRDRAIRIATEHGLNHLTLATDEMSDVNYVKNDSRRCYYCKSELYGRLRSLADMHAIEVIVDGTNADDLGDHRPGRQAAEEFAVSSPLADIGFSKTDIRELSRRHGLETWDIPASPCLASRIQYGTPVTIEKLGKVEQGEAFLRSLGFREFRVRSHGDLARLEFARSELKRAFGMASDGEFGDTFRSIGFRYVTIDMDGFESGSMNRSLSDRQQQWGTGTSDDER